jgi:hypothetical protein
MPQAMNQMKQREKKKKADEEKEEEKTCQNDSATYVQPSQEYTHIALPVSHCPPPAQHALTMNGR